MGDIVKQMLEEVILEKTRARILEEFGKKVLGEVNRDITDTVKEGLKKEKRLEVTRRDIKSFISKKLGKTIDDRVEQLSISLVDESILILAPSYRKENNAEKVL